MFNRDYVINVDLCYASFYSAN